MSGVPDVAATVAPPRSLTAARTYTDWYGGERRVAATKTTLIVMDGEERKFWVTDPPEVVAKALEAGGFVPFEVMSGGGTVWVNSAKVRELGERHG